MNVYNYGIIIGLIVGQAQSVPCNSEFKIGLGEAWNEIFSVEHYKVVNSGNKQGKTISNGPTNPLGAFEALLKTTFYDKFFIKCELSSCFGNKGLLIFNQSLQEDPFDVIGNLDGDLKTVVCGAKVIGGYDIHISDRFKLGLGLGFFMYKGKRTVAFQQQALTFIIKDFFNAPIGLIDAVVKTSSKTEVLVAFLAHVSKSQASIRRIPAHDIICFNFPQFVGKHLRVEGKYKFNKSIETGVAATFISWQATKNGCVILPQADNNLFTDNSVTFFRSQYFILTFFLGCRF